LVSKVTGKNFAFAPLSVEQYREGLAAPACRRSSCDAVLNIQEMWSAGGFDVTTGDVERLPGRPPRSLEDALRSAEL
jgi:NAD(P)H dehydrogenase (quinone)